MRSCKARNATFSVLVTNYNYASFIAEALDSIIAQTFSDFEVIVVDDGSTDNSRKIIRSYTKKDSRIKLVIQKNGGQAKAFNTGFLACRGANVCFMDADDLWAPTKLEWLERIFRARQDVALVQHNLQIMNGARPSGDLYRKDLMSGDILADIAALRKIDFFVPTSGIAARKAALDKVFPIPGKLRICADAYITRAALAHGPLLSLDIPLAFYRVHGNNCWTGNPARSSPNMVMDEIMPLVLRHYRRNGVRGVAPTPKRGVPINQEALIVAQIVLDRIRHLRNQYGRIAIYGAGAHTRWLMDVLAKSGAYPDDMPVISAIMDDNAEKCQPIAGMSIQKPEDVDLRVVDAIVLSSDCFQPKMRERLKGLFNGHTPPMQDLYEGLPAGPYVKIQAEDIVEPHPDAREEGIMRDNAIATTLVVERLRKIRAEHLRIAIYGGVAHIEWIAHLVNRFNTKEPNSMPSVAAVMTDNPREGLTIAGLPVTTPLQADHGSFDAIVVASDTHHQSLVSRLRLLFHPSPPPIINPYEGLPPRQYMKIA